MSPRYVPAAVFGALLLSGLVAALDACRATKPSATPVVVPDAGDASAPDAAPPPPPVVVSDDPARIESFVTSHVPALTKACWSHGKRKAAKAAATLVVTLNIDGEVLTAKASGTAAAIDRCIEQTVRQWHFPTIDAERTVSIPIRFRQ